MSAKVSVTCWVQSLTRRQPKRGFIPPKLFQKEYFVVQDSMILYPNEQEKDIPSWHYAAVVCQLTRWLFDKSITNPLFPPVHSLRKKLQSVPLFQESWLDMKNVLNNENATPQEMLPAIYKLVSLGFWGYLKDANQQTIHNISVLSLRSYFYIKTKGHAIIPGIRFSENTCEKAGSRYIGDSLLGFVVDNSLISLRTFQLESNLNSRMTLQGFIYYLLGKEAGDERFLSIKEICFYNPRLNIEWSLDISLISGSIIQEIKSWW